MKKSKKALSFVMAAMLMAGSAGTTLYTTDITVSAASEKLSAPTGLKYTALSQKSLTLTWNAVSGAKMYAVYKYDSKSGKYKVYKKVTGTSCEVTGLKASTSYKFRVAAMKSVRGKLTAQTKSDPITVKTKATAGTAKPGSAPGTGVKLSKTEGKVFNIYTWNEEFKNYFDKYYVVPSGITVNWTINPNDDGMYEEKLDYALANQSKAAADDKVDLFLVEPDYIRKYVDSDYTMDVSKIGVKPLKTEYQYTIDAATDSRGKLKGVSYQCCPSALIYRRSIAEAVLGTSDPDKVQKKLSSWEEFGNAEANARELGYSMVASPVFTYRVFSQNKTTPWVDYKGEINLDEALLQWAEMSAQMVSDKTTNPVGMWTDVVYSEMTKNGKTMCYFGPSWYYNYSMSYSAQDAQNGTYGDWAICQGPQAHYYGGVWLLAAKGSDNPEMIADVMNAFTSNKTICTNLSVNEDLFTNNMTVNQQLAKDKSYGNPFLGGQNDIAVLNKIAKNIKYSNTTVYDQDLDDGYINYMFDYFNGYCSFDEAYDNFLVYVMNKFQAY